MKKFLLVVLTLSITSVMFAGVWKTSEEFQVYKIRKADAQKADNEGNTYTAVVNYLIAAQIAEKSNATEIQAWQLNNAGYCLIKKFMEINAGLTPKQMTDFELLVEARGYLQKAKDLDIENTLKTVEKNLDFCNFYLD